MKYTKKLLSLVLVLVLALALAVPGFAAGIKVVGATKGETYKVYKIFDVTKADGATDKNGYAYKISTTDEWWDDILKYMNGDIEGTSQVEKNPEGKYIGEGITLTSTTTPNVYNVTVDTGTFDAADFAEALAKVMDGKTPANGAAGTVASDINMVEGTLTIEVEDAGYYFVDTSLGSLCSLLTSDQTITLVEKNDVPQLVKTADKTTASIGDEVTFTIKVSNIKEGTDKDITVHDKMSSGLVAPTGVTVYKGDSDDYTEAGKVDSKNYEFKTSDLCSDKTNCGTFEVVLKQDYVDDLTATDVLYIVYKATVNSTTLATSEAGYTNSNTAYLTYSNQSSTPSTVKVYTYEFPVYKYTGKLGAGDTGLADAVFTLSKNNDGSNPISFMSTDDGYRVATKGEAGSTTSLKTPTGGHMTLDGLAAGTYYLTETAAPAGYNLLTAPVKVVIDSGTDDAYTIAQDELGTIDTVNVQNNSGSVLPSTGGMGTTIFYTLGGVLVVGAAILLVTKKRVHDVED